MSDARKVTLSGYLAGEYDVVDERDDGTLVLAPRAAAVAPRLEERRPPAGSALGGLLGRLISRPSDSDPRTVPELLSEWGVPLADGEQLVEFAAVELDGRRGFAALTTARLLFSPESASAGQWPLATLQAVTPQRIHRRAVLRVDLDGRSLVIGAADGETLARLERGLQEAAAAAKRSAPLK
jgi:hypothetical protein